MGHKSAVSGGTWGERGWGRRVWFKNELRKTRCFAPINRFSLTPTSFLLPTKNASGSNKKVSAKPFAVISLTGCPSRLCSQILASWHHSRTIAHARRVEHVRTQADCLVAALDLDWSRRSKAGVTMSSLFHKGNLIIRNWRRKTKSAAKHNNILLIKHHWSSDLHIYLRYETSNDYNKQHQKFILGMC